jgi:hypothetical protein
MFSFKKKITTLFLAIYLLFTYNAFSEEKNVLEVLEIIQKDLKTLERAVYSDSVTSSGSSVTTSLDQNAEDVLTRHLLKLSEIEIQFQELTNKFEEINFKLDKLSNRLSKVQADNQMRFQEIEERGLNNIEGSKQLTSKPKDEKNKILPGSSEPQDLGAISYKDTSTNETTQQTQSVDTTNAVVSEIFESEEKILPNEAPEKQYEFATSF